MSTITPNNPPCPAYRATNKESFAYDTTIRRWPIIVDSAITDVRQTMNEETDNEPRVSEGRSIIAGLEEIKRELLADSALR